MAAPTQKKRGGLQRRFIEGRLAPENITEKVGSEGRKVTLKSNFTNFRLSLEGPFYMYDVKIENKTIKTKLELFTQLSAKIAGSQPFCYDGRRLFTTTNWHKGSDIESFTINDVQISIRFLVEFLKDTEQYYQMVNIILNNVQVFMGQERIGRQFFIKSNAESQASRTGPSFFRMDNFKILGGFATTLSRGTTEGNKPCNLLYLERINRVLNDNTVAAVYSRNDIDSLIGRDVITKHNNKTYRINDIKEMRISDEIDLCGKKISFAAYFKQRYNITLTKNEQPFIITKVRRLLIRKDNPESQPEESMDKDQCLSVPGELCCLCGFSDAERANFNLQKNLGSVLKREPVERLKDVGDFVSWTQNGPAKDFIKSWNLRIDSEPLTLSGREINSFNVTSGGQIINSKSRDDWKFGEVRFDAPRGTVHRIGVVVVERNSAHFAKFIEDVEREINKLRIAYKVERVISCRGNEIEDVLSELIQVNKVHIALIFVNDDRSYTRVKAFTITTGLLTQCVTHRNGTNRDDRRRKVVADKTVMQMFAKIGYDPWGVEVKLSPTMVVGLDTFHSKTGKRSVQASVFSISTKFSQYISFVNSTKGKNEYHDSLDRNFAAAIKHFKDKFNILPQRYIIYRDGVGDSQLYFTKMYETDAVLKIIERIYQGENLPELIFVVVKKRIAVKFFRDGGNPNAGTVVDEKIVKPNYYEFYLVSQKTTKGTASPTNYNVLMSTEYTNKNGEKKVMTAGQLQNFTYGLTHLYFNWMGTIRVPVPTHYAHRLAELVGKVHRGTAPPVIHDKIRDRLFYL